jgi:hypothetical protein
MRYLFLGMTLPLLLLQARGGGPAAGDVAKGPAPAATRVASAEPSVQAAIDLLCSEAVARLEIYYYPIEVETPTRVSPQELEDHAYYRISIDEREQESRVRRDVASALAASPVVKATKWPQTEPECRWGCVFYDTKGKRILTMYFEGHGWGGLIGGTPVTGIGPVVGILQRRCSSLWR